MAKPEALAYLTAFVEEMKASGAVRKSFDDIGLKIAIIAPGREQSLDRQAESPLTFVGPSASLLKTCFHRIQQAICGPLFSAAASAASNT